MKPSGTGRILFWQGGSLWIGLSGEPADFHSHHAIQISFSLRGGEVRFRQRDGDWRGYAAAAIAANHSHAFEARDEYVAMIFVEPESRSGLSLQLLCKQAGILALEVNPLREHIDALNSAYQQVADNTELANLARSIIGLIVAASQPPAAVLDRRIERAVTLLRERISEPVMLAEVAGAVFLSPDRFRHLFIEQTGMRFRPYVLWLRIEVALAALVSRQSLTDASHTGGFADSAHFSRTFKRMFGISPSSFLLE